MEIRDPGFADNVQPSKFLPTVLDTENERMRVNRTVNGTDHQKTVSSFTRREGMRQNTARCMSATSINASTRNATAPNNNALHSLITVRRAQVQVLQPLLGPLLPFLRHPTTHRQLNLHPSLYHLQNSTAKVFQGNEEHVKLSESAHLQ